MFFAFLRLLVSLPLAPFNELWLEEASKGEEFNDEQDDKLDGVGEGEAVFSFATSAESSNLVSTPNFSLSDSFELRITSLKLLPLKTLLDILGFWTISVDEPSRLLLFSLHFVVAPSSFELELSVELPLVLSVKKRNLWNYNLILFKDFYVYNTNWRIYISPYLIQTFSVFFDVHFSNYLSDLL